MATEGLGYGSAFCSSSAKRNMHYDFVMRFLIFLQETWLIRHFLYEYPVVA